MSALIDWLDLRGAQKDAAETRGVDILVSAGAGSGKTRTLVARYVTLLHEGKLPQQVVAVTFTEKAAREMRNRIRAAIREWRAGPCPASEAERWEEVEADVDTARIGTIHSLCASLIRSHPAEAMLDPRASVLEEGLSTVLKTQAVDDTLVWATGQAEFKPLFEAFRLAELEEILAKLLANRLEALSALRSDLPEYWQHAILKTIGNFAHDDEVAGSISTMRQLRESGRLVADAGDKLGEQIRGLLEQWESLEGALESRDHLAAARALYKARKEYSALNTGRKESQAKEALRALRARYDSTIAPWLGETPDPEIEQRAAESIGLFRQLFEKADRAYRLSKEQRQAVDFDDLEDGAVRLLEKDQIRTRWQRKIAAVLVDEFQDTNERQRRIVERLAGISEGMKGRLFVVGDAKQSIYRFRGADVAVFQQLKRDILRRGGKSIELDLTFRAHEPLVEAMNELLGSAMGNSLDDNLPNRVAFSPLRAERSRPRPGLEEPYVEFLLGLGETSETARPVAAKLLARRLLELRDRQGVKWEEVALLFRAAAGFPDYEAALEEAGIPFVTVAGKGFYDRPEVRDLLNILAALADPWDDLAMAGLLRSPAFGLSDAALYQLRWPENGNVAGPLSFRVALRENLSHLSEADCQKAERARAIVDHLSSLVDRVTVAELIKEMIDTTLYRAILSATDSGLRLHRNIDKLLADASASGLVRVTEFLEYVATLREGGAREGEAPAEAGGAVRLMSVHRAKGLEFPVVVIADAARSRPSNSGPALLSSEFGLVLCPSRSVGKPLVYGLAKALDDAQSEYEDLRVLYVAATRAKEKLVICGHYSGRQSRSWLTTLAGAAGLDIADAADKPGEQQVVVLPRSSQKIAVLAENTVSITGENRESPASVDLEPPGDQLSPLIQPVARQRIAKSEEEATEQAFQLRRITRRRHADGTIVGSMVHEAIRRWRFPGNPALARLLHTAALSAGLIDAGDIDEHVRQASLLLARLQSDPRWKELDAAKRWHEVPYAVSLGEKSPLGVIDLLYRRDDSESPNWCIIDFKTDHVSDEAEFSRLTDRYTAQVRRYRQAVSSILKGKVQTTLCFLDYYGGILWEEVR